MSFSLSIIAPVPTFTSALQICSDFKLPSEEKPTEAEDKPDNTQSFRMVGSSLTASLGGRRNSAFSIYDHNMGLENLQHDQVSEVSSFSSEPLEQQPKRAWKREKKDKRELSRLETKNLNRYFRSKINEMLRDIRQNSRSEEELRKADEVLDVLNKSNKIMFSEIREIIKDEWLQTKLLSCTGVLLKYIHGGKMGMQSKLIMLKYFNKILKAIRNPQNFTCWK